MISATAAVAERLKEMQKRVELTRNALLAVQAADHAEGPKAEGSALDELLQHLVALEQGGLISGTGFPADHFKELAAGARPEHHRKRPAKD
jgi:hypothetical protein